MSESDTWEIKKSFTIHTGDVGSEAYRDGYVQHLERRLAASYTVDEIEEWLSNQAWKLFAAGDVRHKLHGIDAYFKAKGASHE